MPIAEQPRPPRLVDIKELCHRSTLCRATIYNLVANGTLQKPRRITAQRVAWSADYIDAWLAERLGTAA